MSSLVGPWDWRMGRDRDGHRTYEIWWLVEANNTPPSSIDDPSTIATTSGLPVIGSLWSDLAWITGADDWAFCMPDQEVAPYEVQSGEAPDFYLVKNTFSTTPFKRCQNQSIQNPLNEPHELSGSWVNKKIRPHQDRDGKPYISDFGGVPIIGPEAEVDDSDWDLTIGFNSANLPLGLVNSLRHHLNDAPLWGLAVEKIKFSKYSFTRRLYGLCNFYYHNVMHFVIRDDWAQYLQDKTYMKLKEAGADRSDPDNWIKTKDIYGENVGLVAVDTNGKMLVDLTFVTQTPNIITRNPHPTGNLLQLGIPAVL